MAFVNRRYELGALQQWWERSERPALVWGRRRVGKTSLIQHFAAQAGVRTIFHTGAGQPADAELAAISRQVAANFSGDIRDLAVQPYTDWRDAFDHLARLSTTEPVLLVLDEFPEIVATAPALPGIMRAFLDQTTGRTKLRIILSGSSVRAMWQMQEYRAPLYGRFDETLLLQPFRPHEAAEMLPDLTPADRALVYGIVGGTPLYLSWWNQDQTVAANLQSLACRPGARLLTEGQLVLATEAGAGEHTSTVLSAIAGGRTKHNEIEDAIGADPTRTLTRLIELRLIEQQFPVTKDPRRTRRKIYRISDEFLSFYLGPLARYRAEIERGLGDSVVSALIGCLDDYMGGPYEDAFRWHLRREAARGRLGERIVAIGPWWKDGGRDQIDAVVMAEPDRTRIPVLVGEAKWTRSVNGSRIKAKLAAKSVGITDRPDELRYAVCAREEVTHADPELITITAADIFQPD